MLWRYAVSAQEHQSGRFSTTDHLQVELGHYRTAKCQSEECVGRNEPEDLGKFSVSMGSAMC